PFETVRSRGASDTGLTQWAAGPEIQTVIDSLMARNGVAPQYGDAVRRMVFTALRAPVPLDGGRVLDGIASADRHVAELEFHYPIPEHTHTMLPVRVVTSSQSWSVGRGWVKGFIDLLFETDGRVYFLDWKTDQLEHYEDAALRAHIFEHYLWQARLYTL